MGITLSPPKANEIEFCVLGPGFGESIVLHIGDGHWVVVDSCVNKQGLSAPLQYLISIGADLSKVDLVVATHWHDDHIRGMGELVRACKNAVFCTSPLMAKDEFLFSVVGHDAPLPIKLTSGVREMRDVYSALRNRIVNLASQDKRIYTRPALAFSHGFPVEIWALSPSSKEYQRFLQSLVRLIPVKGARRARVPVISPNDCSVVLHVQVGSVSILLGADLEEGGDPLTGWSSVVSSQNRPQSTAMWFKVPHHGSKNGHHSDVWRLMLQPAPVSVLAPFNRSKIPTDSDKARLKSLSSECYATATGSAKARQRSAAVGKMLKDFGQVLTPIALNPGMVRGRVLSDGSSPAFTLHDGAVRF